jgi:hypothetical protein
MNDNCTGIALTVTGSLYVIILIAFLGLKAKVLYRKNTTAEAIGCMAKVLRNPGSMSVVLVLVECA